MIKNDLLAGGTRLGLLVDRPCIQFDTIACAVHLPAPSTSLTLLPIKIKAPATMAFEINSASLSLTEAVI